MQLLALTVTLALIGSTPVDKPSEVVSAKIFNKVQRKRRNLGEQVKLAKEPKPLKTYNLVKHKLHKRRRLCNRRVHTGVASWYGPGLWGSALAFGGTLSRNDIHFAHRYWPQGRKVYFHLHGKTVRAPVNDRGPYVSGRDFDFTQALKNKLGGFDGVTTVKWSRVRCWR